MQVDVIVVGGGPAGSAAAYDLAEKGFKVVILEKTEFPRFKPCAGGVTPKAVNRLRYSIAPVVKRTSNAMWVGYGTKKEAGLMTSQNVPVIALTVRTELDDFCLKQTLNKGVQFELIDKITEIKQEPDSVTLLTKSGKSFSAKYLIGADGAHSRVRKLTEDFTPDRTAVAIEGVIPFERLKKPGPGKIPNFTFDFGVAKKGYGWMFPKDNHVNVGVYTRRPDEYPLSKDLLRQYCRERLGTDDIDHMVGFPLGTGGEYYQPTLERVFLVGDAGGMCEPLLGEGIHNAIKSGQAAAEAIILAEDKKESALEHFRITYEAVRKDVYNCRRVARWFYGGLVVSYQVMSRYPVKTLAMNGFAAGLTVTECKHNLERWQLYPETELAQTFVEYGK